MRPLHESGPTRTAVSTIVRERGHVKGENKRIARKVYWGDLSGAASFVHAARRRMSQMTRRRQRVRWIARVLVELHFRAPVAGARHAVPLLRGVIRHFVLDDLSALHYEFDALKLGDVGQRIS
jgi:hypothetical protein